jgi:hypothetical protein
MRGAERIVLALAPPGEAAEAPALPKGADAVAPAGDDLVRIGLMADVPDQLVVRRVEHIVKRHGELDDAECRAEMSAGDRHRRDRLLAQLVGELRELVLGEPSQVGGHAHRVEQRSYRTVTHQGPPYAENAFSSPRT